MRPSKYVQVLGTMASLLIVGAAATAATTDYVALVKAGTHKNFTSIRSCAGSAEAYHWEDGKLIFRKYGVAWDGSRIKILSARPRGTVKSKYEAVFDGEKSTTWTINDLWSSDASPSARVYAGMSEEVKGEWMHLDPRRHGLMDLTSADLRLVRKETVNGDDCAVVEFGAGLAKVVLWVDLDKGFSIVRVKSFMMGRDSVRDERYEVKSFGSGVWGPTRYWRESYDASGAQVKRIAVVFHYNLNVALSDDDFRLKIPSGAHVEDLVQKKSYTAP